MTEGGPLPHITVDVWMGIMGQAGTGAEAASMACVCKASAAAQPAVTKFLRAPRITKSGHVHPPLGGEANGYDVKIAPGQDMQARVDACPKGGCVLLMPGRHVGKIFLREQQDVHIFGSPGATLVAFIHSHSCASSITGLHFVEAWGAPLQPSVCVSLGNLRIQCCIFEAPAVPAVPAVSLTGGQGSVVVGCQFLRATLGIEIKHHHRSTLLDNRFTDLKMHGVSVVKRFVRVTSGGNTFEGCGGYCFHISRDVIHLDDVAEKPNTFLNNRMTNVGGEGFLFHRMRREHAALLGDRQRTYALLNTRLEGIPIARSPPAVYDFTVDSPNLFSRLYFYPKGATVLLVPGVYHLTDAASASVFNKDVSLFGGGGVTLYMDERQGRVKPIGVMANVMLVGLRIVFIAKDATAAPPSLIHVATKGRLMLQSCVVETVDIPSVRVAAGGSALVIASRVTGITFEAGVAVSMVQRSDVGRLHVKRDPVKKNMVHLLENFFTTSCVVEKGASVVAVLNDGANCGV